MALFNPIPLGAITLKHRVAMAPLTRFRANKEHQHTQMATTYYEQRAGDQSLGGEGGLIITEATFISEKAGGYDYVPGIYTDKQVKAWKEVVDAVHAKGSFIYLQLWSLGRAATGPVLRSTGTPLVPHSVVSASNIPLDPNGPSRGKDVPRELSIPEVEEYARDWAEAARKFVVEAGGDGVEIHGANGYLIDQFTQTNSNVRTDKYGGSVESRCRFALEVVKAVSDAIGEDRTGIRLSPFSGFQGMKMTPVSSIYETFTHLITKLKVNFPKLAYLHVTEPRVAGGGDQASEESEDLEWIYKLWSDRTLIVAGTFTAETAEALSAKRPNVIVAFGRYFISNPDLPLRIKHNIAFTPYDRKTFYTPGPEAPVGYIDYLTASQQAMLDESEAKL